MNHVTHRVGHLVAMHIGGVPLAVLSMGDGDMSLMQSQMRFRRDVVVGFEE